jgi:hypothetical protein
MNKILFAMFTLAAVISLSVSNLYAFPIMGAVQAPLSMYEWEVSSGPEVSSGDTLSFQGDALTLDPLWDDGGNWQQVIGVEYTEVPGLTDSGSTAPIPEPGTMMMLGISILTLAGYGKIRLKK